MDEYELLWRIGVGFDFASSMIKLSYFLLNQMWPWSSTGILNNWLQFLLPLFFSYTDMVAILPNGEVIIPENWMGFYWWVYKFFAEMQFGLNTL